MPTYNLHVLASRVMSALRGGILTAICEMPHNTPIFWRILGAPNQSFSQPFCSVSNTGETNKNNHDGFILRLVKIILLNLPLSAPVENRHNPALHSTTTTTTSTCRHNFVPTPNSAVPQSGTVSAGAQSKYTGPVVHTDCSSRLRADFTYHVLT